MSDRAAGGSAALDRPASRCRPGGRSVWRSAENLRSFCGSPSPGTWTKMRSLVWRWIDGSTAELV